MRLIKCYIENFGLLHAQEYNFNKGINCCISDNGTGKTTLASFIEAMLYGIGDTRRVTLDENPRKKYYPWQGGKFGGSLTFETGKRRYTVERSFGLRPADDTFRLIDAQSGKECDDLGEDIGEKLFGIDRDGFLRTVYLSEKNLQGKNENKSISAKLSDLVGVDGDVGGFDAAIKLLEDRRKFYFKKGNTGEIANVRERISECQRRLDNVEKLKAETEEKEANLKAIRAELNRLGGLEGNERQKLVDISKQHEKLSHEEQYSAMLENLKSEKAKLASAKEFFKNGVPTFSELEKARDAYLESERLKKEAYTADDSAEFARLRRFFARGTDFVEIAEMEREAILLTKKEDELKRINEGRDPLSIEIKSVFKGKIPTEKEISALSSKKRKILPFAISALIGILCAVVGFIIGGTPGIITTASGAALAVISVLLIFIPQKNKELLAFLKEFDLADATDPQAALESIRRDLQRYNALCETKTTSIGILEEEIESIQLRLFPFLEKFPITGAKSIIDVLTRIKADYSKFFSLGEADAAREENKLGKATKSDSLYREAMSFLAKYPTSQSDPFTEIRTRLNDYNYLSVTVQRMENECDAYSVRHGVSGKATPINAQTESAINNSIKEISERREELSRKHAVLEREIRLAYDEIDRYDEINLTKESEEELLRKYCDNLETIKATSALLKEACNNITSKYLGKTKSSFEEYSCVIAGIEGEYSLSTEFEISKSDRGAPRSVESYSRGLRDMYALAMRFALVDALYEKEAPFIILDDPFLSLDDSKIERAKSVLKTLGKSKQILYFTCSKSREI